MNYVVLRHRLNGDVSVHRIGCTRIARLARDGRWQEFQTFQEAADHAATLVDRPQGCTHCGIEMVGGDAVIP